MIRSWEVTVEVLTGLHIRAGNVPFKAEWDFVIDRGRLFVLDLDLVYDRLWRGGPEIPRPGELLRGRSPEPFARYTLELAVRHPQTPVQELWPLVRDPVTAGPIIPGSSLKGLIRTAAAWALYGSPLSLGPDTGRADDPLEAQLFGGRPHVDVLRALRVSDFPAAGPCRQWAARVELYGLNAAGRLQARPDRSPGFVEAVGAGAAFKGTVSLDLGLIGRAGELRFNPRAVEALQRWPEILGRFGARLLAFQVGFYRERGLPQVADRLEGLRGYDGIVACLGWGGGWPSKTVGLKLTPQQVAQVAERYNLRRWRGPHFPNRFPSSRRLLRLPEGLIPLGWVGLKIAERK
jgi:hypothetical protein